MFKSWVHEGGIASPLIAAWGDRIANPGSLVHDPAHVIDIVPTMMDLGGARYPSERGGKPLTPLAGRSFAAALRGQRIPARAVTGWEHQGTPRPPQGDLKIVAKHRQPWELYDLAEDRTELNDIAAKDPNRLEGMRRMYEAWARQCGVEPWDKINIELDAWLFSQDQPPSEIDPGPRRRHWLWPALAAAAAMLLGGGWYLSRTPDPTSWRIEGKTLVVTDARNRDLWSITLPPDQDFYDGRSPRLGWGFGPSLIDLDGDGHLEFLRPRLRSQRQARTPAVLRRQGTTPLDPHPRHHGLRPRQVLRGPLASSRRRPGAPLRRPRPRPDYRLVPQISIPRHSPTAGR
jgi:hypothetical protein